MLTKERAAEIAKRIANRSPEKRILAFCGNCPNLDGTTSENIVLLGRVHGNLMCWTSDPIDDYWDETQLRDEISEACDGLEGVGELVSVNDLMARGLCQAPSES